MLLTTPEENERRAQSVMRTVEVLTTPRSYMTAASNAHQTTPFRVLIVDDEENARIGLSKLLAGEGHQVRIASEGGEALQLLETETADLVITDIKMPGMSGLVFLEELQRCYPHMKVIMITAYGGVESYLEAINLGAFEYLSKPVSRTALKAVINKLFHQPTGPLDDSAAIF